MIWDCINKRIALELSSRLNTFSLYKYTTRSYSLPSVYLWYISILRKCDNLASAKYIQENIRYENLKIDFI